MPENADATGQAVTATGSDELAAAREELRKEKEKHAMAANLARNQQQENERLKRQNQELQARREAIAARGGVDDAESNMMAQMRMQLAQQREQTDLLRFKVEHPDADMTELQTIYTDPTLRESIVITDNDGNPNVYVTLKNSFRELRARKADEMLKASQNGKAAQAEEQARQRAQATISGVSGSAPAETIDVSNLTSDEMIEKGLIEVDPADPIRPRPQMMRRTG